MPLRDDASEDGEAQASLSFLEDLPDICEVCHRLIARYEGRCIQCYVEEELDLELIYEAR